MSDQLPNAAEALPPGSLAPPTQTDRGAFRLNWLQVWVGMAALAVVGAAAGRIGGGFTGLFLPVLAFLICLLAAWHDAAVQRVPNPLTYTALLLGVGINLLSPLLGQRLSTEVLGAPGLLDSLFGLALCAGIGLASLLLAGMGGGDLKLMAALGAILGLHGVTGIGGVAGVLLWALLLAVAYALVNVIIAGRLNAMCQFVSLYLLALVFLQQPLTVPTHAKKNIPLAVPLVAGLILSRLIPQLERLILA